MIKFIVLVLTAILVLPACRPHVPAVQIPPVVEHPTEIYGHEVIETWSGTCVAVTDGDTIKVLRDNEQVRIRLDSIDCPEMGQAFGNNAKQRMSELVFGKDVTIYKTDTDFFGREIAWVFVDGTNVNEQLLRDGLAWVYLKYNKDPGLIAIESEAKSAKRGLWSAPDPVPPWDWRRIASFAHPLGTISFSANVSHELVGLGPSVVAQCFGDYHTKNLDGSRQHRQVIHFDFPKELGKGREGVLTSVMAKRQNSKSASAVKVITGNALTMLPKLEEQTAQCCVTSPPYWGLRDYDHPAQIGAEESPVDFVQNLVAAFREVRRVLRDDGTLWLNIGDGYARNGGTGNCGPNAVVGNTKRLIQKRNCKVPDVWGLKDRDLFGMPWRVAFALQEDGWILRSRITWIKKTAMPESVRNRPTNATEEVFLFAKKPKYFYDRNGVREESGANLRNYWILGPDPSNNGHPASFPRELARRCILLGSREGDLVLDPFGGSGTTGVAATETGRRAIVIELNPEFARISRDRAKDGEKKKAKLKAANT